MKISKTLLVLSASTITAYCFFLVGQDNPPVKPLSNVATIACPLGSKYSLIRGNDATVTIKCITK